MKKIFVVLCTTFALLATKSAKAQTFSMFRDTVFYTYSNVDGGVQNVFDRISVPASATNPVILSWKVIDCNFPTEWLNHGSPGLCDNNQCYSFSGAGGLWPAGYVARSYPYSPGITTGTFDLQINLQGLDTAGTHYVTARLTDTATGGSTKTATFMITYILPSKINALNVVTGLKLYPNPATETTNVQLYLAKTADVAIAVYDVLGRLVYTDNKQMNTGEQQLEVPVSGWAAGVYNLVISNEQGSISQRFSVIK